MNRFRLILAAWLLLLVPTLLIGVVAMRAVRHEQDRLAAEAAGAAGQRARVVAEGIQLAVGEVRDGLLASLRGLPPDRLMAELEEWERQNPLVRNTFVWDPEAGVLLPDPAQPGTEERSGFLRRYEALFAGRVPWEEPAGDQAVAPGAAVLSSRLELRKMAAPAGAAAEGAATAAAGWMPWFSDNRLHFLAWAEASPGGRRYGVEVETLVLLGRLLPTLPGIPPAGQTWALLDDGGRLFHQSGAAVVAAGTPPLAAVSLGPGLPHWEVAVYGSPAGLSGSFRLLSGLLVGAFVAAILFGGTLLLWQAHRHLADARRKTSFVSNVSHELKTPLTTIRMYAELLAEGRVREEAKRDHYLGVIVGESQRLTRLVNNVLDFSRLEQGRKTYALETVELAGVLHAILDAQGLRFQEQGMQLERRIPEGPFRISTDRDALEQAVLNLVDNGLKYGREGGELTVELRRAVGACEVAVLDRGPGIPAAHRKRVFEKFHRVDESLTAREPGSGLGLAIARQLLRDLGGDLTYRPREGGGACFIIRLPCTEGET